MMIVIEYSKVPLAFSVNPNFKSPTKNKHLNMKRLSIVIFSLLWVFSAYGQQEPLYTQYMNNHYLINPAVAGSTENHEIRFHHRFQWFNLPGAPRSFSVTYQGGYENSGFGLKLYSDITGPTQRIGAEGGYAYHVPLTDDIKLGMGLSLKYLQYSLDLQNITFVDPSDEILFSNTNNINVLDASAGLYLYGDNFWAGLSAPNIIQAPLDYGIDDISRSVEGRLKRHFFVTAGYFLAGPNVSYEASILLRKVEAAPLQGDLNIRVFFLDEVVFVGASYRQDFANLTDGSDVLAWMVGVNMERFHLAYTYDFRLGGTYQSTYGSAHEVTMGIDLGPVKR